MKRNDDKIFICYATSQNRFHILMTSNVSFLVHIMPNKRNFFIWKVFLDKYLEIYLVISKLIRHIRAR